MQGSWFLEKKCLFLEKKVEKLFDLIENTSRDVFLTGKAGTGKTTFLNDFIKKTAKNFVVVAPTGIAAINASGVTIHSMFTLPLHTFVPTTHAVDPNLAINIPQLTLHFKYRKDKVKLLRELELLIIDEVSMLRADVMDMMDLALRFVRRNQLPFGGVQLLLIGDLHQLPPVVRESSERVLNQYYNSPFFFHAMALQSLKLITVELTKVYRQSDEVFLEALNAIRTHHIENKHLELLNSRYQPDFEAGEAAYIYLVSHNAMADKINQKKIQDLKGKDYVFRAQVDGDFKENQYPNEEKLILKVGAQIMFIRNDVSPEKKYYNGKIGKISYLNQEEIRVILDETHEEIEVNRETWEQKKYLLDKQNQIQEQVTGSFVQFPIRLAWAVTIHKSQGLTFEKVIIDAGKSFAPGQVYVALSRCKTLEGIVLKTKISREIIFNDLRITQFHEKTHANDHIEEILETEKYNFAKQKILQKVDVFWLQKELNKWLDIASAKRFLDQSVLRDLKLVLCQEVQNLVHVYHKFENVLSKMIHKHLQNELEWKQVEDKCKGAIQFFYQRVYDSVFNPINDIYLQYKTTNGVKEFASDTKNLLTDLEEYLQGVRKIKLLGIALFDAVEERDVLSKMKTKPTHLISFELFEKGKTISEIAKMRSLAESTIYGHLAKIASVGILAIEQLFDAEKIRIFQSLYTSNRQENLTEWKRILPVNFDFHEIRIFVNYFDYLSEKSS